jgi:hypothetical protein
MQLQQAHQSAPHVDAMKASIVVRGESWRPRRIDRAKVIPAQPGAQQAGATIARLTAGVAAEIERNSKAAGESFLSSSETGEFMAQVDASGQVIGATGDDWCAFPA